MRAPRLLSALLLCLVSSLSAHGQNAIVTRDVNLRADPSTDNPPIRLLGPETDLELLEPDRTNGYYHVRTEDAAEGWVWGRNVQLQEAAPTPEPTPPTPVPTAAPTSAPTPPPATPTPRPSPGPGPTSGGAPVASGDFNNCPVEGDAIPATVKALNILKNRATSPTSADIDPSVTLSAILAPGNDTARWDSSRGAEITGYVVRAFKGGVETTNCKATDALFRDTHIELALDDAHTGETQRVIVEVTPRWRAKEAADGVDWTTETLSENLTGHHVRFRGWLFFDAEHKSQGENTAPGNASNWRATAWELHPVTRFEVLD